MKIENVTFVVIAKNEFYALNLCLKKLASFSLINCQVIAVDSNSTDNTLASMVKYSAHFSDFTVVHSSGYSNSAVARNIGIKYATKKYLFFLDGDVVLSQKFLEVSIYRLI